MGILTHPGPMVKGYHCGEPMVEHSSDNQGGMRCPGDQRNYFKLPAQRKEMGK